ncbi:hypothetical protein GLOTRDRAFT_103110 [Gloeophyllum trabeum ATCC 11539]|uniref:Uncharacterized protein n=1 Tax=Gloeophyllum trabeum (strain ATCC 11539 / FP-39264 / Madison 617) TaxID=670483 RepID=S7RW06_GLOTA|nr:uncharacterized protein GLOTRDRAFT_103110 [Gloeophyllum trabeum ATCC 11539]EPQ59020.1 hypothetical protein GLOTRDRAFT_103110 [Gloeophyllum trabeum ATCC 11539]
MTNSPSGPWVPTTANLVPPNVLMPSLARNAPAPPLHSPTPVAGAHLSDSKATEQAILGLFGFGSIEECREFMEANKASKGGRRRKGAPYEQDRKLIASVHYHALLLLGCDPNDKSYTVPEPLPLCAPVRTDAGGVRLYNPVWAMGPTSPRNREYIDAVVSSIEESEKARPTLGQDISKAAIRDQVRTFFAQLRRRYQSQVDPAAKKKQEAKNDDTRSRQRRKHNADAHRDLFDEFKEKYKEQAEGIEKLIMTDWGSSECSDEGNWPTKAEAVAYRRLKGGGDNAWEVRRKEWRSEKYNRIIGAFRKLRRQKDEKDQEAARTSGKKKDRLGRAKIPRVLGADINANHGPPRTGPRMPVPYEWSVSREWAKSWAVRTGNAELSVRTGEHLPVFDLDIPDEDIDPEYLDWITKDLGNVPVDSESNEREETS